MPTCASMAKPSRARNSPSALMETVGHLGVLGAGGIELGHPVRQGFLFLFEGEQIGEDGHAFGEDGAAGKRETFLRQVADAGALHGDHACRHRGRPCRPGF